MGKVCKSRLLAVLQNAKAAPRHRRRDDYEVWQRCHRHLSPPIQRQWRCGGVSEVCVTHKKCSQSERNALYSERGGMCGNIEQEMIRVLEVFSHQSGMKVIRPLLIGCSFIYFMRQKHVFNRQFGEKMQTH